MRIGVTAALCLATLLPAARATEEAVLPDGRHLSGTLTFAAGRLRFQPGDGAAPLALADLHAVRFAAGPSSPLLVGRAHRVLLPDGQALTGQLLGLDGECLRLRTVWAAALAIPRPAVSAVTQLPGWNVFFADDFGPGLRGWQATGNPGLGEPRSPAGQHGLLLSHPGQAVTHAVDPPVAVGWFAVDFRGGESSGARWLAQADFRGPGKSRTVRVVVAGAGENFEAEVPGMVGTSFRLARTPGWHRLRIDFAADALAVTVDDTALWYAPGRGPGGALRQVRLACAETPGSAARGEVAFADVSLARALPEVPHPAGDPGQDEVWLASGDQLFGRVPRADSQAVEVSGRFGSRALPWAEVRGLFLRETPAAPPADAQRVRVWLAPGAGEQRDQLVGTVRAWNERGLALDNPLLGECKIDRARLRRLRDEKVK